MTYCLALKLNEGLVFCSDSRTNAGPDQVSRYSKMHRFSVRGDRQLVLLASGNLATTQAVVTRINRDMLADAEESLARFTFISEIADYVGRLSRDIQEKYGSGGPDAGFDPKASFILGGQLKTSSPEIFLIYPEGNHIRPSELHPYLQIGETKYGKPILDRIVKASTTHETAMRCALVSMDSTIRSSATVGGPVELLFLERDNLSDAAKYRSFKRNDPYLTKLRRAWNEKVISAFNELPSITNVFEEG